MIWFYIQIHRVKKKDFLSLANYYQFKQGKKSIKSATTVLNRARPRNVRSIAARAHKGKWLFCAKNHLKQRTMKMCVPNIRESMFVMLNRVCLVEIAKERAW